MLQITGIAKTEVIFVHSLISGSAPNLQVTLQRQKTKRKNETSSCCKDPVLCSFTVAAQFSFPNEKLRFYIFYSPRFNLNTPKSPYASITLE